MTPFFNRGRLRVTSYTKYKSISLIPENNLTAEFSKSEKMEKEGYEQHKFKFKDEAIACTFFTIKFKT